MNEKQMAFCHEYLKDKNATQAAIRAGYSPRAAYSIGQRLLKNDEVSQTVNSLLHEISEKCVLDAERVLEELCLIGFSDLSDYMTVEPGGGVVFREWENIPTNKSRAIRRIRDRRTIREHADGTSTLVHQEISIDLHDKMKALESLGRHIGLFKEAEPRTSGDEIRAIIEEMRERL